VDIECILTSVNIINVWCYSDPPNTLWLLSCIYGPLKKQFKFVFWDSLLDVGLGYHGTWLCVGDFNMIMSQYEKFGGRPYACSFNDVFHGFLDSFGMIDLGFSVLSNIGSTKALGSNGFTALFYKKYWSIVKDVVLSSIWDFFENHHLQREQNHTFTTLIPKQLGASSVHQFRPISLCNIIYKIISKILANKFKGLHHFISPHQSAFVPTITIQDNTIMAHEHFHTVNSNTGRGGLMAIKIDMEKAFDRMKWNFILAILSKLGFHSTWINWIRICITSPSFLIFINGSPYSHFNPERGIRQGDPLSPYRRGNENNIALLIFINMMGLYT
jgi:hypothetical protein